MKNVEKLPEKLKALINAGDLYWESEHGVIYNDDAISAMRNRVKWICRPN